MASSISTAMPAWKARKANAARESCLPGLCPIISLSVSLLTLVYGQASVQSCELGTDLPDSLLGGLIVGGFRALAPLVGWLEVAAVNSLDLGRRCQVDRRSCRLVRGHELPSETVDGP